MKIIVVGGGKVGFAIASEVSREGHDVTVIERDVQVAERLSAALDIMVLCGNGAELSMQREAGVSKCDLLIAATPNDELNMICCILARKLGCPEGDYYELFLAMVERMAQGSSITPYRIRTDAEFYQEVLSAPHRAPDKVLDLYLVS